MNNYTLPLYCGRSCCQGKWRFLHCTHLCLHSVSRCTGSLPSSHNERTLLYWNSGTTLGKLLFVHIHLHPDSLYHSQETLQCRSNSLTHGCFCTQLGCCMHWLHSYSHSHSHRYPNHRLDQGCMCMYMFQEILAGHVLTDWGRQALIHIITSKPISLVSFHALAKVGCLCVVAHGKKAAVMG